ncbi:uncharacterized protein [Palaemon carinicauda]|uniref:uncharacterized protein n=1 Tax=Palaemon carinicauda TaxID=392227 RepID=UPI0035B5C321
MVQGNETKGLLGLLLFSFLCLSTAQACKNESLSNDVEIILSNINSTWKTKFKVTPDRVKHWTFNLTVQISSPKGDTRTLGNLLLSRDQSEILKLSGSVNGKSIMEIPFPPNPLIFRSFNATSVDLRIEQNGMINLTFNGFNALEEYGQNLPVHDDTQASNTVSLILKNRTGAGGFWITYDCFENRQTTTAIVEERYLKTSHSQFDEPSGPISKDSHFPSIEINDPFFKYLITFSILVFALAGLIFICIMKTNKSRSSSRDISYNEPRFAEQQSGNFVGNPHQSLQSLQKTPGIICPSVDHRERSDEHSFEVPKLVVREPFVPAPGNSYSKQTFSKTSVAPAGDSYSNQIFSKTSVAPAEHSYSNQIFSKTSVAPAGDSYSNQAFSKTSVAPAGDSYSNQTFSKTSVEPAGNSHSNQTFSKTSVAPAGDSYSNQTFSKHSVAPAGHSYSNQIFSKTSVAPAGNSHSNQTFSKTSVAPDGHSYSNQIFSKTSVAPAGDSYSNQTFSKTSVAPAEHLHSNQTFSKTSVAPARNSHSNQTFSKTSEAPASLSGDSTPFGLTNPSSCSFNPSRKASTTATNTCTTRATSHPIQDEYGMMKFDRTEEHRSSLAEHIYESTTDLDASSQAHSSLNSLYGMTFVQS